MKPVYILLLILFPTLFFGQSPIKSTVVDSKTKQSIAYCNIFNKSTQNGVISNADGDFSIKIRSLNDTISISFLGYETRDIPAKRILAWNSISLKQKQYELQEVEIHSSNDYLYDILTDCRNILRKSNQEQISKAFFILNTSSQDQPLELLECYYNAHQKAGKLDHLYLKNGRFALLPLNYRVFLNFSTSQVFNKINFVEKNEFLPNIILQYRKRGMKKKFQIKLDYSDTEVFKISFIPKENKDNIFSGEIWIDKKSYFIKKVSLYAENLTKHPFLGRGNDSLTNISIKTEYTFTKNDTVIQIDHIVFNMQMNYYSLRGSVGPLPNLKRSIKISSTLYFYDFDKPFILPYFKYDNHYMDYRKISIIPYNKTFWENRKLLLTKEQKKQIKIMTHKGVFINYDQGNFGKTFMLKPLNKTFLYKNGFWEYLSHIFWSSNDRIIFNEDIIKNQKPEPYYNNRMPRDMYHFEVQIFLDINLIDSIFDCRSYTLFDLTKTFYRLEDNNYSNVFINIYFDICEIERQQMEKELLINHESLSQIDSIYNKTISNIEEITSKYLKEVQHGNNVIMLMKWNDYVANELGINNLLLFNNE